MAVQSQTNVLYGERTLGKYSTVYLDKDGTVYPEYRITDAALKNAHASLNEFLKQTLGSRERLARESYHHSKIGLDKE